jgi:GNAT superfamily N-acetyltransferase
MILEDIPLGMRLKTEAGWNQLEADWKMLLHASSEGCFVAVYRGLEVGTVTTVTYDGRFSWIGMLLVDPAFRRKGIGTALLQAAINVARRRGAVRLDATPLGKTLYDTLGFRDEYHLVRMQRTAGPVPKSPAFRCAPLRQDELHEIVRFDEPVFGAQRGAILGALLLNAPEYAYAVKRDGQLAGYCLGRPGSNFEQIGPIVAKDSATAQALVVTALANCPGRNVIIDAPVSQESWLSFLNDAGFSEQRPFIRMCLGTLHHPGQPKRQYGIAGPEVG